MALRLRQLSLNLSLWLDESSLALNVLSRSFGELLGPLDHGQGAPPLFLWLVKATTDIAGTSETSLRLAPFVAGLVGLLAFVVICYRIHGCAVAIFGATLFALSPTLRDFSVQAKQYSVDVLCSVVVVGAAWAWERKHLHFAILAALGIVLVWLSHPVAFVLAGAGLTLLFEALGKNERARVTKLILIGGGWLTSFGILDVVHLGALASREDLVSYWSRNYHAYSPFSRRSLFDVVHMSGMDSTATYFAVGSMAVGIVVLLFRDRVSLGIYTLPIFISMLSSQLGFYPFADRLVVFWLRFSSF